jgi:hypothetical protein
MHLDSFLKHETWLSQTLHKFNFVYKQWNTIKWTHLKDIVKKIWLSKCYTQLMTQIKISIQLATIRMVH